MSQAARLIETLTHQGIDLWVDGGQLRYRGPKAILTPERLAQLKAHKGELLHTLTTTTYAATWEQQQRWAAYHAAPEKRTEHVAFAAQVQGALAVAAFQRTWQTLVQRHATLRTIYHVAHAANGQAQATPLVATVLGAQAVTITQLDAQHWHAAALQAQLEAQTALPFDLAQGPLLRITLFARAAAEQILLVTAPRIALDEPSLAQLLAEFGQLYVNDHQAAWTPLPPLVATPAAYAAWQRAQPLPVAPVDTPEAMGLNLPLDYPRGAQPSQVRAQTPFVLDADLTARLHQIAAATTSTLDTILLMAFHLLLQRYTGQEQLFVNLALSPRRLPDFCDLVGGFTTLAPFATTWETTAGLAQSAPALLAAMQQQVATVAAQLAALPATAPISQGQVAFAFHPFAAALSGGETLHWGELTVTPLPLELAANPFELQLDVAEVAGTIRGVITYRPDLFAAATITRMGGHLHTLLAGIVAEPTQPVMQLPMLTAAERHQLLVAWNNTATAYPQARCLHQWFEAQVERTPDAVALLFDNRASGESATQPASLTYRELNQRANQLAHYLQSLGVGPETLVGLCVERSPWLIIGVLGILKAGGAYVPLDPTYPAARLAFMLQDAAAAVLLTQAQLSAHLAVGPTTHLVPLDSAWTQIATYRQDNPPSTVQPHHLAYVLYTSGSTGQPKGVMIEHRSPTALLAWGQRVFTPTELAGVLFSTSICFDLSVYEIFLPLSVGGKLILVENALHLPTNAYKEQVTLINTVPSSIEELLRQQAIPAAAQTINLAGEPLRQALVEKLYALPTVRKVYDLYGPSEDTTYSTFKLREAGGFATIGKPIDNTQAYILDPRSLQPLPIGVPGELHLGGQGLARGYWQRPELTAAKFIPNPLAPQPTTDRLYKTGDLARWLPDGNLEFLGRIDNQVKLRGFRIELGEIEATLAAHPAVQEAVVMAQPSPGGYQQLTAYIVPRHSQATAIELWPSLPEQDIYDELIYYTLTSDEGRNDHYKAAIAAVVAGKTVVEIGTGQDALLAIFCVQAGATRVYAIEIDDQAAQKAAARVQQLGLSAQIQVIHGDSTKMTLPALVDICISGIVGPIGGGQGAVTLINDAHRFLKPDGLMIPSRCITSAAAVTLPEAIYQHPQFTPVSSNYVHKIFAYTGYPFDLRLCIRRFPQTNLLSSVATFEALEFAQPIEPEASYTMSFTVEKSGRLDGFLVWMQMHLGAGEVMDILAGEYAPMPVYFPIFDPGIAVTAGDQITATSIRTLSDDALHPDYVMRGCLTKQNGEVVTFEHHSTHHQAAFRQHPFYARLFAGDHWHTGADRQEGADASLTPATVTPKLRHHLAQKLPDYMVPATFMLLDALPLTPNGKVDRRALPLPTEAAAPTTISDPPRNPVEAVIAQIWGEALNRPEVGIHEKFMELGGHSLLAMQVVSKIASAFQIQLPLNRFFEAATVAELAQQLINQERKPGQMTKLARLHQRLNQLAA